MRELKILNLGAGVQSTTLYLLSISREEPGHVPAYDAAIFADTGEEPAAVYEHLDWLRSLAGPPILVTTIGRLGDDLIRGVNSWGKDNGGRRFASIPAYTKAEGDPREGRLHRQCTRDYKVRPVERAIRRQLLGLEPGRPVPAGVSVEQHLGLSYDEPSRVVKVRARFQDRPRFSCRFPLFELEWDRSDCRAYLEQAAPGRRITKSACVFCPYRSNAEWKEVRDRDPAGWARALEVDRALRQEGTVASRGCERPIYVHRSCVPLEDAPLDEPEPKDPQLRFGFDQECEGMCGV